MGFVDWIKGAAQTVGNALGKGIDWVGHKVIQPATNWLKQNVPVVSDVIKAAEPIGDTFNKLSGALQGKNSFGLQDVGNAVKAGINTYNTATQLGSRLQNVGS